MELAAGMVALVVGQVAGGADLLERRTLASGVPLAVLQVKDASLQSFLAFVPTGLGHDAAGRTQWAHLLEHMLIRSTDPESLSDGDIRFNGETGDGSLRLDVHAPLAQAPQAAAKLCAWLRATDFDAEVLEREKKNIASEIASTTPLGYGHKWATAAWNQVVRHNRSVVSVQGDVDAATVEAIVAHAANTLKPGSSIALFAAGPMPADEVTRLFDAQFAGANATAAAAAAPVAAAPAATTADPAAESDGLVHGEITATWDLPRAHLIEWYLLPDSMPEERLAAATLANALSMTLSQDPLLKQSGVIAMASADIVLPTGRVLQLSASLPEKSLPGDAASATRIAFRRALDGFGSRPPFRSLDELVAMTRNELAAGLPDLTLLRKQIAGRPNAELMEAQLLLGIAHREWSSRLTLPQMVAASQQLDAAALSSLIADRLTPAQASVVLLLPRR
ncbi:MAG: insulinase family protein [Planctomycetes bacterium]|nr:insulinase family protein [Planctomycetota bacterium]